MSTVLLRPAVWRLGLLTGLLLISAGCNDEHHKESGGGMQSSELHAQFDRDSRNNEDNTLGVKSKWLNEQPGELKPDNPGAFQQLDMNNYHLTKTFRFAPEIAKHLEQNPGIHEVTVLLTEGNAYVAVVPDGHNPDTESHPDMIAHQITPKGGVGLFGTDVGQSRINWGDPGGLSTMMSSRIQGQVLTMTQPVIQRVFIS
ncbi:MAG: hypothetical protein K0S39_4465, partial [Paenibacillus sp.]|nr:hypothetical protein [Paenibacillus sp.]